MSDRLIIKIQRSIETTEPTTQVLIYTEDNSILIQVDASEDLLELFDEDELKIFHYARLENKHLTIDERAPWQDW